MEQKHLHQYSYEQAVQKALSSKYSGLRGWKFGKETKEHSSVMPFSYSNFVYKQTNKCAVAYFSQRGFSVQVWGGKKFRTVGEALLFKKQNKQKKETTPAHIQLICAQLFYQFNTARAKAVPIPLTSHLLAPEEERAEEQLCLPPPYTGPRSGWSQGRVKDSRSFTLSCLAQSQS